MPFENINSAGWSRNSVTWSYNTTFKIKNNEFTFGKEFYTLTVRVNTGSLYAVFSTKYYPATTDDMPALYLYGEKTLEGVNDLLFGTAENGMSTAINIKRTTSNISNVVNASTHSDYGGDLGYYYNQGNGRLLYGLIAYDGWARDCTIEIDADFPIFMPTPKYAQGRREPSTSGWYVLYSWDILGLLDDGTCNGYLSEFEAHNYTHINKAVNYYSVTSEIPSNQVWTARTHLKQNEAVIAATSKAYDFKILPDAKIWFVYTAKGLNGDASANLILHISESPWLQKNSYAPDSAYAETSSLDTNYWMDTWQDYDNGDTYTGWLSTNIPIFDSEAKGDAYAAGDIGIDEALNGGDTTFSISTIGDDLSSSEIPTVNLATSGAGCFIYDLSVTDVKEIMSTYLYTDDASLKAEYVDALWLWGNNPIDFFIDLYYIPFSITNFYDTTNANLKFGTYQIPDTSYDAVIEANGDRITLFNTSFEGVYGDWRDYTFFTYELFLPYVGFIELDPQKYINKMVSCEMMFDITTHNLRYYLFADGVISDRVDGSVGVNIPLMATDQVNKAKNDRNSYYSLEKNKWNFAGAAAGAVVGGVAAGPAGAAVGATVGILGSAINAQINANQLNENIKAQPTEQIYNSFSSSMNIYDISYAYLKITEKGSIIPSKLHSLYGYPCYYMGKGSALSGYCELSDIRLSGFTGTIDEANTLKTILREGVIL